MMRQEERETIVNALKVIKLTCESFKHSKEIKGDPCLECPFCADDFGNCALMRAYNAPCDWIINSIDKWRALI